MDKTDKVCYNNSSANRRKKMDFLFTELETLVARSFRLTYNLRI